MIAAAVMSMSLPQSHVHAIVAATALRRCRQCVVAAATYFQCITLHDKSALHGWGSLLVMRHVGHVVVSGLDIHMSLDQCLPFLHKGPELVGGEVHAQI